MSTQKAFPTGSSELSLRFGPWEGSAGLLEFCSQPQAHSWECVAAETIFPSDRIDFTSYICSIWPGWTQAFFFSIKCMIKIAICSHKLSSKCRMTHLEKKLKRIILHQCREKSFQKIFIFLVINTSFFIKNLLSFLYYPFICALLKILSPWIYNSLAYKSWYTVFNASNIISI